MIKKYIKVKYMEVTSDHYLFPGEEVRYFAEKSNARACSSELSVGQCIRIGEQWYAIREKKALEENSEDLLQDTLSVLNISTYETYSDG